jgi:hypothetical protein
LPASVARAAADAIDAVLPPAAAAPSPARARALPPADADARAPLILPIGQPTTDAVEEAAAARVAPSSRRKSASRKSFSRKSLDPLELKRILGISHSPCGRAEKAAAAADPKAAILGLQAEAAEVLLSLFTTEGALHARVLTDGSVLDREGRVLAFVEADGSVGSAAMDYVGEVNAATGWISDADETPIAMLDQGRVSVKVRPARGANARPALAALARPARPCASPRPSPAVAPSSRARVRALPPSLLCACVRACVRAGHSWLDDRRVRLRGLREGPPRDGVRAHRGLHVRAHGRRGRARHARLPGVRTRLLSARTSKRGARARACRRHEPACSAG